MCHKDHANYENHYIMNHARYRPLDKEETQDIKNTPKKGGTVPIIVPRGMHLQQ
jgi:hypothetical protein